MALLLNRIVENPGRVRLTPVAGQPNVYDVEREEGAIVQAGTPLNADTLVHRDQILLDKNNIRITPDGATYKLSIYLGNLGYRVTRNDVVLQQQQGGEGMWLQDIVQNRGMWLFSNFIQMKSGSYLIYEDANEFKVQGAQGKKRLSVTNAGMRVNDIPVYRVRSAMGLSSIGYGGSFDNDIPSVPSGFTGRIVFYVEASAGNGVLYWGRGRQQVIPDGETLMAVLIYGPNGLTHCSAYLSGGGKRLSARLTARIRGLVVHTRKERCSWSKSRSISKEVA